MKIKSTYIIITMFALLLALILASKTTWSICSVCGVQDFERAIFGKKIELISNREVDEYGTYAKWKEKNGIICDHQWVLVDESSDKVREHIDSLK